MVVKDITSTDLNNQELDFGTFISNTNSIEREIIISNSGGGTFDWTITGNESTTYLSPATGTVSLTPVTVKIYIKTVTLGAYTDPITITASNGDTTVYSITMKGNVIDNSISGKTFAKFTGDGSTNDTVTWTDKLPNYPTKVTIYYYTNDFGNNDLNIALNGKINQILPKSFNILTSFVDTANGGNPYLKTSYYLKLN